MYLHFNITCSDGGGKVNKHFDGQVSLLATLCIHIYYIEWYYYLIVIVYPSWYPLSTLVCVYNYTVMHIFWLLICIVIYAWFLTAEYL